MLMILRPAIGKNTSFMVFAGYLVTCHLAQTHLYRLFILQYFAKCWWKNTRSWCKCLNLKILILHSTCVCITIFPKSGTVQSAEVYNWERKIFHFHWSFFKKLWHYVFCVASGTFTVRSKQVHAGHMKVALENNAHCFGVILVCVQTQNLSHCHVISPHIPHDTLRVLCQWGACLLLGINNIKGILY